MPKFSVILLAAGKSTRFNDPHRKKPYATLGEKPVWLHSVHKFRGRADVAQIILVVASGDIDEVRDRFSTDIALADIEVVAGGEERQDSVRNGLRRIAENCDYVAIHDAARPCIDAELIERVFEAAVRDGAALPAIPVSSTVKRSVGGMVVDETVSRAGLFLAQTPQVFRRDVIESAYRTAGENPVTDDAQVVEKTGGRVTIVEGSPWNIKLTTRMDLRIAESFLVAMEKERFDSPPHPFQGDRLWR